MGQLKLALCIVLVLAASDSGVLDGRETAHDIVRATHPLELTANSKKERFGTAVTEAIPSVRYTLDAGQSQFMVRTFSGGALWFKGHDHFIKVRDFTGEAALTLDALNPASLQISIRADSLEETRDIFTEQQKQIINKELREIVLETAKYPEISFKSTEVTGRLITGGQYEAKIGGDLTLHGVTRHITIPAQVTVKDNDLRARGEFSINRNDFGVKATSAKGGLIRVRSKLKFTFEIVAHQI